MTNLTNQLPYQKETREDDREFLDWLKTQPSAYSGQTPCDPAHYRTAANSGTGMKPQYSAIPLTREEHLRQHQIGQYAFMPRHWWEGKVAYYVSKYLGLKLRGEL